MCLCAAPVEAADPARIVSTSPSITETLFALGLGDRVVGVSTYCRYPQAALRLPKVGTLLRPDAELIARLRPDLVIVHAGPHTVPQQLSALGIASITVDRGTLAGVYSSIRAIGAAAGVADRAARLVAELEARLAAVQRAALTRSSRKVLVIVGRQPGTLADLIAVGRGSYLNDLVTIAGGVNVLDDPRLPEYPRISMETVIRLDPDVIVDAGDMGETEEEHRRRQPTTERLWRQQLHVRAAQAGAVHAVTSDAFVVPGPRVVEAAETLAALACACARPSRRVLSLRDVGWRAGATPIVERVTFEAGAGEFVALMGRNGAGKSTLLDLVAGLRAASEGSIALDGRPLSQWTAADRARAISSSSAGRPRARPPHGGAAGDDGPVSARRSMVRIRRRSAGGRAAMAECGCLAFRDRRVATLSGGERQRVLAGGLSGAAAAGAAARRARRVSRHRSAAALFRAAAAAGGGRRPVYCRHARPEPGARVLHAADRPRGRTIACDLAGGRRGQRGPDWLRGTSRTRLAADVE